ncbi:MAG: glycosyltransferase family 4 protein [Planctomycetes bacterium]|nr:glycosyltransferase family 4 protein [Planctomycetota bacterium]
MEPPNHSQESNQEALVVRVALCVGSDALDRYRRVLRHLAVGMVDQAVQLRWVSSDPRIETLTLGPVQTTLHPRIGWPIAQRRLAQLCDALSSQPPLIVHALSGESYRIAGMLASTLDAEVVLQVTSLSDCQQAADLDQPRVGKFIALTNPLSAILVESLGIEPDRVEVIRPGIQASRGIASFADEHEAVTLLCTSALERDSGVDHLIEAAAILENRGHDFLLFLLGQGSQESSLRLLVRQRRLSSCVTFAQPMGNVVSAMQSADIFIRPSADTAFMDDGLHAMGAGTAMVTLPSDVCDHFQHDQTAVVCDKPTAKALADAIERLLTDRAFAQRIAKAALEYVRTHHAMSRMAESTAAVYRRLALARTTLSIR